VNFSKKPSIAKDTVGRAQVCVTRTITTTHTTAASFVHRIARNWYQKIQFEILQQKNFRKKKL
jgi:hypothetical protein